MLNYMLNYELTNTGGLVSRLGSFKIHNSQFTIPYSCLSRITWLESGVSCSISNTVRWVTG
jgi:hypothetical protein